MARKKDRWINLGGGLRGQHLGYVRKREHHNLTPDVKSASSTTNVDGGGRRDNTGKLRVDLVPADVIEALAEVLGFACTQRVPPYPPRNWERGMKWSNVVASLERHLLDVKLGRRLDPSGTGLRSTALLLCNAVFLAAYDLRGLHHLDDLEPYARARPRKARR